MVLHGPSLDVIAEQIESGLHGGSAFDLRRWAVREIQDRTVIRRDDEAELAAEEEDGSEEDEIAFMEVSEYVRMGILLIYEELQPLQSSQTVH